MNIIVVGMGRVGTSLAASLTNEQHDVTVIDPQEMAIESAGNMMDVIGYVGNGASYEVLHSVGAESCDVLIAVTGSDELNIMCCLSAKKIGVKHTVARVREPDYAKQLLEMKDEIGLSMFINPERAAALEIARILRFPSASRVELFSRGQVELVSFRIPKASIFDGVMLREIPQKIEEGLLICAIERDGDVVIPKGDFMLRDGDEVYMTGSPKIITSAFKKAGMLSNPARNVMISGGDRVAYFLSEALAKNNTNVKIVESNEKVANSLAEHLPSAVILMGDATDHELLSEEGIEKCDAFVALTGLDEGNILTALYAKSCSVPKIISKVNNDNLAKLAKGLGIETVISPKSVMTNAILRYVRAIDASSSNENILSLYKILGGRVEVLEFSADGEIDSLTGIPLSELKIKKNILIACITRGSEIITPSGSAQILPGDLVLVITSDIKLNTLSDILRD